MDPFSRKQIILKAASHAERVRMKCGVSRAAAVDPILLAEQRGCEVRFMSLPSLEGAYSPSPRPVIVLGSERPAGRRAFTCMHELGHHEFGHGMRMEELKAGRRYSMEDLDEFIADMFAATLLMAKTSVHHSLRIRDFDTMNLEPIQIFRLASFFGVGYNTLIEHMTLTLGLLNRQQRENLRKTSPKQIKSHFGCSPQSELVMVDDFWQGRAVDLEVGDILVMSHGISMADNNHLSQRNIIDGQQTYQATSRGYLRVYRENNDWATHIRIAPNKYEGLACYRFLNDPEEDIS